MRKVKIILALGMSVYFVMTFALIDTHAQGLRSSSWSSEIQLMALSSRGVINGNGVRLRSNPSISSVALESLNANEEVLIDRNRSTKSWYYVQRTATGTYGWVARKYVTLR